MTRKVDESMIDEVLVLHAQGMTPGEIHQALDGHISRPLVYYYLKRAGLRPNRTWTPELTVSQATRIRTAYDAGESMASISRRMHVTYDQVREAVGR